jgi:hypothetical protein
MAYTVTITGNESAAVTTYAVNSADSGKYLRHIDVGGFIEDLTRFRVPGTDGHIIVRGGNIGHKLTISVRYIADDIASLYSAWREDVLNFTFEDNTITFQGATYKGCNMVPGSAQQTSPVLPTGRALDQVFADFVVLFTEDQPDPVV